MARFYESHVPKLLRVLERIADQQKESNTLLEQQNEILVALYSFTVGKEAKKAQPQSEAPVSTGNATIDAVLNKQKARNR